MTDMTLPSPRCLRMILGYQTTIRTATDSITGVPAGLVSGGLLVLCGYRRDEKRIVPLEKITSIGFRGNEIVPGKYPWESEE